jgi:hypothetical protein
MKRNIQKTRARKNVKRSTTRTANANNHTEPTTAPTRRRFLEFARNWGIMTVAATGGGWYLVNNFVSAAQELDLSKIGNGIPTVVQIHDPECSRCRELQKQTRDAMESFDNNELQFLVANIRQDKGRELAETHRVGHVTLLLFDGDGKRRGTLVGVNPSKELVSTFRRHIKQHGQQKKSEQK